MKKFVQQILIVLFSGVIVIASGGFSLIHHYCGCSENESVYILIDNSYCHEDMNDQFCEIELNNEPVSCCQTETPKNQTQQQCGEEGDCCSSEYHYFKTDNFDLSGNHRVNLDFTIAYKAIILDNQSQKLLTEGFTFQINNNLPPPEYGKELLYSIHQLKIATPLV